MGIKVTDIAYVRFRAPDLDRMEKFLVDFGMTRAALTDEALYMRGTGAEPFVHVTHKGEPGFVGLAFEAESAADLEKLAAEEGVAVEPIAAPGGGSRIILTDPNGFPVEVVHGRQAEALAEKHRPPFNGGIDKERLEAPLRVDGGPAQVKRLGHCVLNVIDFRESEAWYKARFGLVTSDEIRLDETTALGAFMRCDCGDRPVDHHTLFLIGAGQAGFNHAAFEVAGLDDLMTGHDYLKSQNYRHEWGVGRHLLGSQIFDYWRDPWGHTVEHWTDGDLFSTATPPNIQGLEQLLANQWGPDAPPTLGS